MKKFLSLVLALAMTVSLVTISAGAKDFTDNDSITYEEAVAVMSEIGVVDGDTAGNFNPANGLTRGAAAKIICNLILGPTTAAELNADTNPYKDVNKDSTFAGYIAYCQKEGIISGYADGTFKPAAPLTGYAFMKMLLGALGYDGSIEGYTGANWSINVAKQAIGIGLNKDLAKEFNGSAYVTREEAMLYAFNTLQATMVNYDTKITANVNGSEVTVGNSTAKSVEWKGYNNAEGNIKNDGLVQFAEKYFTKLVLDDNATDAFGRPANKWINDKQTIGTYVDYTLLVEEYTAKVTGKDLYDLLGKDIVTNYDVDVFVDGKETTSTDAKTIAKNYKDTFGNTGNGVLTQVFVDNDKDEVIVAVINTFLAKVDADYNEKKDAVSLTVYGAKKESNGEYVKDAQTASDATVATVTITSEDFDLAKEMLEKQFYTVTLADGAVQTISTPDVMSGVEIESFKKTDNYTVAGTTYSRANTGVYNDLLKAYTNGSTINLKDTTYNVYTDAYGYVLGIEVVDTDDNYVFIAGYDAGTSALYNKNATANAIFTDGTVKNIQVKTTKGAADWSGNVALENSWYTYTVDKNDVYTLVKVYDVNADGFDNTKSAAQYDEDVNGKTIDKSHISVKADASHFAYGNDDTIYLVADLEKVTVSGTKTSIVADVQSVTTGTKNVSIETKDTTAVKSDMGTTAAAGGVYTLYNAKNGYVIAAVVVGEDSSVSSSLIFTLGTVNRESYNKADDEYTWTLNGLINGEEVTLTEKGDSLTAMLNVTAREWYKVSYKGDGTVKDMEKIGDAPYAYGTSGKYIQSIVAFNAMTSGKGDVTLIHNALNNTKVSLTGYTLHIGTAADNGIDVLNDCKAVLVEKWTSDWKTTIYDASSNNVKSAVTALQNKDSVTGDLYAVMKDGLATTIIIVDTTEQKDKVTGGDYNGPMPSGVLATRFNAATRALEIDVMYHSMNAVTTRAAIANALAANGVTVNANSIVLTYTCSTSPSDNAQETITVLGSDGWNYTVTVNKYYGVEVNGTLVEKQLVNTAASASTLGLTGFDKTVGTGYINTQGGTTSYATYSTAITQTKDGGSTGAYYDIVVKTGYVAVTGGTPAYAPVKQAYTVPAKGSNNGTGFKYTVGTTDKFVAYGGTIPAEDVTADLSLTADQILVTYTGFATASDNKTEIKAYNENALAVPAAGGSAGTGVKVTGITGTEYKAYNATGITANGADITFEAGYFQLTGLTQALVTDGMLIEWKVNNQDAMGDLVLKAGTVTVTATVTAVTDVEASGAAKKITAQVGGAAAATATIVLDVADTTNVTETSGVVTIAENYKIAIGEGFTVTFTTLDGTGDKAFSFDVA